MKIKYLTFHCGNDKCEGRVIPMFFGLIEGYKLRVEGYCGECGDFFYMNYPIEKLIADCPGSDTPFGPVKPPLKNKNDNNFLRGCGINPNGK